MSRQCTVCTSTRKDEIETFAKQGIPIWKIVDYLHKQSIQLTASSISRHLRRHTNIDTSGLLESKKETDSNTIEDKPIEYIKDAPLLSDAEIKRRKIVRDRKRYYGETDAEIDAAFLKEDQAAKKLKDAQEAMLRSFAKGDAIRKANNEYQFWKRDHEDEIKGLYEAFKEKENGSKEN